MYMYSKNFLIIISFFISALGFIPKAPQKNIQNTPQYELPEIHSRDQIIKHLAYTVRYNEEHEQADWDAYRFIKSMTTNKYVRTNKFRIDPSVKTGSSNPSDYINTGYDKGHLTPCDDMRWSKQAESESFFMSNMSPQIHSFNAGVWKRLEGWVGTCVDEYDTLYVVSGPILQPGLKTIGKNKVSVPNYFYKVVLVYTHTEKKCIGFILPHKKSQKDLMTFAVSVDSVEKRTGINFFATLPDSIQNKLESILYKDLWKD